MTCRRPEPKQEPGDEAVVVTDKYAVGINRKHGDFIICRSCQKRSYNLGDIEHVYCGHCKVFHEDP